MHPRGTAKAPASPHTTRAGGAYRDGHPGKVKPRGGGRRAKDWMGELLKTFHLYSHKN